MVTTLPNWGKYFDISVEIFVTSLTGPNTLGYSELLRFTANDNNCFPPFSCSPGDRIPAIFVKNTGKIQVSSVEGLLSPLWVEVDLDPQTWNKIEIIQYPENGKVNCL